MTTRHLHLPRLRRPRPVHPSHGSDEYQAAHDDSSRQPTRGARVDIGLVAVGLIVLAWLVPWPFGSMADVWLLTIKVAASLVIALISWLLRASSP